MNSTDERIVAQAGEWLLELQESDVSVERIAEWQQWLARNPEHARAFAELQRTSTFLDLHLAASSRTALPWPTQRDVEQDGRIKRPIRWAAVAATLAVIAVGTALRINGGGGDALVLESAVGEHRDFHLSDGSTVWLGAASRVRVAMKPAARTIDLDRGEAYFLVAKDPRRPFSVRSGNAEVTAVGTAFNVRRAGERVEVGVSEGVVAISASSNVLLTRLGIGRERDSRLDAGQRLVIEPELTAPLKIEAAAPSTVGSWREGRLHYAGEPLASVVSDLNRYSNEPIVLADVSIAGLRVTGTVSEKNISSWLKSLQSALPIEVVGDGSVLKLQARAAAR